MSEECPNCHSNNFSSDMYEVNTYEHSISRELFCNECDFQWLEIYNFARIETLDGEEL